MSAQTQGLVAQPGSSVGNHTGDWRTERPRFLQAACTGCDLCVVFCPDGVVFKIDTKRYDCDLTYCKGCGICARECPVDDVVMEAELR